MIPRLKTIRILNTKKAMRQTGAQNWGISTKSAKSCALSRRAEIFCCAPAEANNSSMDVLYAVWLVDHNGMRRNGRAKTDFYRRPIKNWIVFKMG